MTETTFSGTGILSKTVSANLRFKKYPYTYTRTRVMRSLLLKKADYDKMMKMTANEIAHFLQESTYKHEVSALAIKYSGFELIEAALNRNLEETFSKIRRISGPKSKSLIKVIDAYLMKYDVRNIKNVLRAKYTGNTSVEDLIVGAGQFSRAYYVDLLKKETIEEILKSNGLVPFNSLNNAIKTFEETKVLGEIENVFETNYFRYLFNISGRIPKQGRLFKEFLNSELEITNIINVLRLKRAGIEEKSAGKYLLPVKYSFAKLLSEMLSADITRAGEIFKGTEYTKIMENSSRFQDSLIELETDLWNFLLNKTKRLINEHPLSVDAIVGYIFAKDMEARNLRLIIKGKQLGLETSFIESQLVA